MKGIIGMTDDGELTLTPLKKGIFLQPNTIYYMGSSSSPDMVVVTDVSETHIEYYHSPYTEKLRIERDIGEDLLIEGCTTWMKNYERDVGKWGWVAKRHASLRELLAGKPSDEIVKLHDFQYTKVEVAVAKGNEFNNKTDFWHELENYGSVTGITPHNYPSNLPCDTRLMRYHVTLTNGSLEELKKDKRFKVIREIKGGDHECI